MSSRRTALPTSAGRATDRSAVTSGPRAGAASAGIETGGATGSSSAGGDRYSGPSPITTCSPMCSGPMATGPISTIRSGTTDMRISGPACSGLMATTTSSARPPSCPVAVVTPATHMPVAMRRRLRMGPTHRSPAVARGAPRKLPSGRYSEYCGDNSRDVAGVPVDEIQQAVNPTDEQRAVLDELGNAAVQAAQIIKASCPTDVSLTPIGRLEAMQQRVKAMLNAVGIVRPTLEKFYNTLTDEQKARFNALTQ